MQTGGAGADCRIFTALLGGRQEGCFSSVQHVLVEHLLCVRRCCVEEAYGMNRTNLLSGEAFRPWGGAGCYHVETYVLSTTCATSSGMGPS